MTDQTESPETVLSEPEPSVEAPAAPELPDYSSQIHTATEAHSAAVQAAHETLSERIHNAYEIFSNDLDRAYRAWDDIHNAIRQGAGIVSEVEDPSNGPSLDPTRAV